MHRRFFLTAWSLAAALVVARTASAADAWIQVKTDHFTVVSNASERRARNVGWQFEQVRAAIAKGWPWARVELNRPVFVIAVKDEDSMRAMAPEFWQQRGGTRPGSVFATGSDRHYVLLRADIEEEGQGMNPYSQAYWSYSALVLEASFNRGLPLWLTNGLASVLSNTVVGDKEIVFGKPLPWLVERAQTSPHVSLAELFAVDRQSPYYRQGVTRERFDAQCWALVQFMLFGEKAAVGRRLNQLSAMLQNGVASDAAVREVYGSLDALDQAYSLYLHQGVFTYGRLQVASDTSALKAPVEKLSLAESDADRAAFHASMGRAVEARALLAEARRADPSLAIPDEVEGMLLDREQKSDEARQVFAKAVAAGSKNYYVYYRLASLASGPGMTVESMTTLAGHLDQATKLNPSFGPAFGYLASVELQLNHGDRAVDAAQHAITLEPGNASSRMILANAFVRLSRRDEALKAAQDALPLARNQQEYASIQSMIASLGAATRP